MKIPFSIDPFQQGVLTNQFSSWGIIPTTLRIFHFLAQKTEFRVKKVNMKQMNILAFQNCHKYNFIYVEYCS